MSFYYSFSQKAAYTEMISIMNKKNRHLYKKMLSSLACKNSENLAKKMSRNANSKKPDFFVKKNTNHKCTFGSTNYSTIKSKTIKSNNNEEMRCHKRKNMRILMINKPSYPFNLEEKRFEWQNLEEKTKVVDLKDFYYTIHRKIINNELNGGFKQFLSKKVNSEEYKPLKRHYKFSKSSDNFHYNEDIKKVLAPGSYPYKNQGVKFQKRRVSLTKDYFHTSSGNIISLFKRTPIELPTRSKKFFKDKSFQVESMNLFSKNYSRINETKKKKGKILESIQYNYFDHFDKGMFYGNRSMEDVKKERGDKFRRELYLENIKRQFNFGLEGLDNSFIHKVRVNSPPINRNNIKLKI